MQTIGDIMRSEREKKGLSVKDIEAATSIRAIYIQAIEDGDYKKVPGEVYLKGFIRNYASYLGLDGQEMINIYRQSLEPAAPHVVETPEGSNSSVPSDTSERRTTRKVQEKKQKSGFFMWAAAALVVVMAAGAAWWVFGAMGNKGSGASIDKSPKQQAAAPPAASPPAADKSNTPPPAVMSGVQVQAHFIEKAWVAVRADGANVFEGTPQAGTTMTWDAKKDIIVKVGNAGGVELTHNGQTIGKLGTQGEVVEKTFTAK